MPVAGQAVISVLRNCCQLSDSSQGAQLAYPIHFGSSYKAPSHHAISPLSALHSSSSHSPFAMGLPMAITQSALFCDPAMHDVSPYKFGASASYAPSTSTFAPHDGQYYSRGQQRQAQTLRNATMWWHTPHSLYYPLVGLPTIPSATSSTTAYPCPPFQVPYQQHPASPLSAIHNVRCAQGVYRRLSASPDIQLIKTPSPVITIRNVYRIYRHGCFSSIISWAVVRARGVQRSSDRPRTSSVSFADVPAIRSSRRRRGLVPSALRLPTT